MSDENRVKLQEILYESIARGRYKEEIASKGDFIGFTFMDRHLYINFIRDGNTGSICLSYHELFSKDSGIMEFVERRNMSRQHAYIIMSQKTAEEKIQYFLDNAILPQ